MAAAKICFKCKFEGVSDTSRCPRCGGLLKSITAVRVTGGLMTLIGVFLVAMMGSLMFWALNAYREQSGTAARFTGTAQQFGMILGLFGLIFVFGLASAGAGLWQLIFGRRNPALMWVIIGLGAMLVIGGVIVTNAL